MQKIIVTQLENQSKATFQFFNNDKLQINTTAYIGKNGITDNKQEGDGKTPKGTYEFGIAFGTHNKEKAKVNNFIKYITINNNLYWVDDCKSKYYNEMVDTTKVKKDWNSAEHLIKYPKQYEYAIEIKTNPRNIPNNGSAIFLHCSAEKPTEGCVAIETKFMKEILKVLTKDAKITIK